MQVGDLICHGKKKSQVGIIVETGKYAGNADIKVLWLTPPHPTVEVHNSSFFMIHPDAESLKKQMQDNS